MTETKHAVLTTSRRPTSTVRTLCKDLSHTIPNIIPVNRGKLSLEGVAEKALELDAEPQKPGDLKASSRISSTSQSFRLTKQLIAIMTL